MYQLINNIKLPKPKSGGNKFNLAKQEAIQKGKLQYFTGKPCKKGHLSNRYVKNNMCIDCSNSHHSNKELVRHRELIKKYGITRNQYNEMLWLQGGVCAICKKKETKKVKGKICDLAVDHCHVTKKIRKLLCYACNVGIGFFKYNSEALRSAALYCEAV